MYRDIKSTCLTSEAYKMTPFPDVVFNRTVKLNLKIVKRK
jgi:hypothetical protein